MLAWKIYGTNETKKGKINATGIKEKSNFYLLYLDQFQVHLTSYSRAYYLEQGLVTGHVI